MFHYDSWLGLENTATSAWISITVAAVLYIKTLATIGHSCLINHWHICTSYRDCHQRVTTDPALLTPQAQDGGTHLRHRLCRQAEEPVGSRWGSWAEPQRREVSGSRIRAAEGPESPEWEAVWRQLVPLCFNLPGIQRARPEILQDPGSPLDEAHGEYWREGREGQKNLIHMFIHLFHHGPKLEDNGPGEVGGLNRKVDNGNLNFCWWQRYC